MKDKNPQPSAALSAEHDPAQGPDCREQAEAILRSARDRALGHRPGLRLLAITAWSAFLGAVVMLAAWLLALPGSGEILGMKRLTLGFVVMWALCAIPAACAALLAQPAARVFDPPIDRRLPPR